MFQRTVFTLLLCNKRAFHLPRDILYLLIQWFAVAFYPMPATHRLTLQEMRHLSNHCVRNKMRRQGIITSYRTSKADLIKKWKKLGGVDYNVLEQK